MFEWALSDTYLFIFTTEKIMLAEIIENGEYYACQAEKKKDELCGTTTCRYRIPNNINEKWYCVMSICTDSTVSFQFTITREPLYTNRVIRQKVRKKTVKFEPLFIIGIFSSYEIAEKFVQVWKNIPSKSRGMIPCISKCLAMIKLTRKIYWVNSKCIRDILLNSDKRKKRKTTT